MVVNSINRIQSIGQIQKQNQPKQSKTGFKPIQRQIKAASSDVAEKPQQKEERFDARAFRRSLNKTGRYVRQTKNDPKSITLMEEHGVGYSTKGLVAQMRENGFMWEFDNIQVKLAKAYGFCWGVERSVQMAYEAKMRHPGKQLHVTNEIIHNPEVNQRLREMDIKVMDYKGREKKDFTNVDPNDVVIFPAFGASVEEMREMNEKQISLVDTTCPWVAKVWNAVDNQSRRDFTSVIHGKWAHEETVATASFAGDYIVVKDLDQAQYVCDYILHGGDKEEFMKKFENAVSKNFDPDVKLDRVGLANQTTMLQTDTKQIGKMLEKTMMVKFGPEDLKNRFMVVDTICDATQERQDAIIELVEGTQVSQEQKDMDFAIPDMILVVGGFNSSNTQHLQEIPELHNIPAYWIDSSARIDEKQNKILHKMSWGELKETENWIPDKPIRIGVTSGASTPDKAIEDALYKIFKIRDSSFLGVETKYVESNAKAETSQHEEVGETIM